MKRFFLYIKFYLEPDDKELRAKAFDAAKQHFANNPVRSANNPYPHPMEYTQRREAFQMYQRRFMSDHRHGFAKDKLSLKNEG